MFTPSERPPHDDERCASGVECFACHLRSVSIGMPSDFRSRSTYLKAPPRQPDPSYERGVPTTSRPGGTVMPFLKAGGELMRQKEFNEKRHLIKDNLAKADAQASAAA